MALQSGLPLLDFSPVTRKKREEYFAAVRAGLERNYEPMEKIFDKGPRNNNFTLLGLDLVWIRPI